MKNNEGKNFRVILLTHGGADEVLIRLWMLESVRVVGVFVETETERKRGFTEKIKRSLRYDGFFATAAKLFGKRAGKPLEKDDLLAETAQDLGVPIHFIPNYHDESAIELMRAADADLGVIYGTNIVRESVFGIPKSGSINLHQGLAPIYRGSAPVFWELYNGEKSIGVTVHKVAAAVDTGDIVLQEIVPLEFDFETFGFDFDDFIEHFRANLKERCARLVSESVRQIAAGEACWKPQDINLGKRYKLPTKREKDELRRRLTHRRKKPNAEIKRIGKELEQGWTG